MTLLGWASLFKGSARLLFPEAGAKLATSIVAKSWMFGAALAFTLPIGAWLTFQGYFA